MEFEIGSVVFNGWKVTSVLGEGGFGKVYEIDKEEYGISAKSAMKVISIPKNESDIQASLNEGMDEAGVRDYFNSFVEMIIQEIAVMSSLKGHPNIVQYEDHEVRERENGIGGDILIKMEMLKSLQLYQRDEPNLSRETVLRIGKDMCSALAFCQKKGMVHRDIKPENIFVSETGQFKLGDFGIARTVEKTSGGLSKKGTESYMAPEVYIGKPYGQSVDIYSLGLVLYRLMNNNRLPFFPPAPKPITYADRENALSRRISGNEPIPMPCNADPAFAKIIIKACAHNPDERYHTAKEMLDALNALDSKGAAAPKAVDFSDTDGWSCSQCGHSNSINADFCTECGNRKPATTTPTPQPSFTPKPTNTPQPSYTPQPTNTPQPQYNSVGGPQYNSSGFSQNPSMGVSQQYSNPNSGFTPMPSMTPQMSYGGQYPQAGFGGVPQYTSAMRNRIAPEQMYAINRNILLYGDEIKRVEWVRSIQPYMSILIIILGIAMCLLQSPVDLLMIPFGIISAALIGGVRKYKRSSMLLSGAMILISGIIKLLNITQFSNVILSLVFIICGVLIMVFSAPLSKSKQAKYYNHYKNNFGVNIR